MKPAIVYAEPRRLWDIFGVIAGIPHGSKNEKALADRLCGMCRDRGFTVERDASGNMYVRVPATPGYEKAQTVVLQGHLDMVCEKNASADFDFLQDGIHLVQKGDWVTADGTTLGADNGIGVAAALAAACSDDVVHGPLEILLTADEETGLTGAMGIERDLIQGRMLVNLDSEESGKVCIGCAGGGGVTTRLEIEWEHCEEALKGFLVSVSGLQGGHSGIDIDQNRANAVRLLARSVYALRPLGARLSALRSGDKHNAIPREGTAVVCMKESDCARACEILDGLLESFRREHGSEDRMSVTISETLRPEQIMSWRTCETITGMLLAFPNGVLAMSRQMPGLVETSSNLASVHTEGGACVVHNAPRSSVPQALTAVCTQIEAISGLAGAGCITDDPYPGWIPDTESALLHIVEDVHEDVFGSRPVREAIHAGLECGIIGEKVQGMDMVSLGPDIINAHSPEEAVSISSVGRFWRLLTGILERIARDGA